MLFHKLYGAEAPEKKRVAGFDTNQPCNAVFIIFIVCFCGLLYQPNDCGTIESNILLNFSLAFSPSSGVVMNLYSCSEKNAGAMR